MGSRERKRTERRKRKRRSGARREARTGNATTGNGVAPEPAAAPSRSELKNSAAREALEPLRKGERPLVVTLGAIVSALIALSIVIAYAAGAEVRGDRPNVLQVIAPAVLMGVMAYGMWRARYWAVLGFQAVLLILILLAALGLVQAAKPAQVVGNVLLLAVCGTFFYLMVKALARIQMPQRLPRE